MSKATLRVALVADTDCGRKILGSHSFSNNDKGFDALLQWTRAKSKGDAPLAVMEATGIYHENLADYLYAHSIGVSIVLPNRIKHFAHCLNIKTKTDKVDALIIAKYGLERRPSLWEPMTPALAQMRGLSRTIRAIKQDLVRYKNRAAALNSTSRTTPQLARHIKEVIAHLSASIGQMEQELLELAHTDASFMERVRNAATIKGVSELTIIHLACETNGFALMNNARQAVSYAGLDVMAYESGTISRKGHISKRGNPRIRQMLYTPALVASRFGPESIRQLYQRVVERNPSTKRKAIVAAERKLLVLIYTLWTNNTPFDPEYRHPNMLRGDSPIASDIAEAELLLEKTGA